VKLEILYNGEIDNVTLIECFYKLNSCFT